MIFNLIHCRSDSAVFQNVFNMMGKEVAQSDGTDLSCLIQFLHCSPCLFIQLPPFFISRFRQRPVDQIQIQIVSSQIIEGTLKCTFYIFISHLVFPQLACDKKLSPGNPALPDRFRKICLGPIERRRIKIPVSCSDSGADHVRTLSVRSFVSPECYGRYLHTIV